MIYKGIDETGLNFIASVDAQTCDELRESINSYFFEIYEVTHD